ncbi:MAG: hypothetical protein BGO51_07155 [Rhodospirillales bacterium 69-11]|nr:MAG: hypothetical protein BGO51_07155 [Rhodospirillales bacterium 69-11]
MSAALSRIGGARKRLGAILLVLFLVGLLVATAGFVLFMRATGRSAVVPAHADGIVALTGGADRVETALRLLADNRADRLLLSGIGPVTELAPLARRAGVDGAALAERVTLGRLAASTRGNALETEAWAHENHIRTLIVVTGYYHMPRALAELAPELPGITLYPLPVGGGVAHRAAARLLVEEYLKYLAVRVGLTHWLPVREPPPPPHDSARDHGAHEPAPRQTAPQAPAAPAPREGSGTPAADGAAP